MTILNSRRLINLISVLILMLWGGISLYFYASGRIVQYLPNDGWFRPLVLWSGVGMFALAFFNLFTMGVKEADCGHDHDHDECDHHHDHATCCDHSHGITEGEKKPSHANQASHGCASDHCHDQTSAHKHEHDPDHHSGCCGHESAHHHQHSQHQHEHGDCCGHAHGDHDHAHGVLNESGVAGKIFAILMLTLPISYAAIKTPDKYSAYAVMNKGVYQQNYGSTTRAEEFSLKKKVTNQSSVSPSRNTGSEGDAMPSAEQSPGMVRAVTTVTDDPQGGVMVPVPDADKIPSAQGQEAKDYGEFTLKDLEAQIPKSAEGNFILEVPEIYYTAGDKQVQEVLKGQPVETVAQILPEKGEFNAEGKRARIFRMMVQCCAADARPYSIPVEFKETAPTFKDMSWVKITGIMGYETQNGQVVPVLLADSIGEATQPDDQMVY